jgi:hypothetical protein
MISALSETGLTTAGKFIDAVRAGQSDSYADYTRSARVNPLMIVDSELINYEHSPVVTQSLHSAFSAYYLMAWQMLTLSIDNIAVKRHLDKLNPNRSVKDSIVDSAGVIWNIGHADNQSYDPSVESFAHRLPRYGKGTVSNESNDTSGKKAGLEPAGMVSKSNDIIKEASNLAVGKILEINVSSGGNGKGTTIPILIQLTASVMVPDLLAKLLSTGNVNNDLSERILKFRAGSIDLIDLLTARDLVKDHKRNLANDKSGIYAAITNRMRSNKLSGLLSMNPTVANASNLVVVDTNTVKKTELLTNTRFSDFRSRQKLFDATGLFIVAEVDQEYDRVKFYTNGIADVTDVSIKECKAANKNEGSSISDILKAYSLGKTPGF